MIPKEVAAHELVMSKHYTITEGEGTEWRKWTVEGEREERDQGGWIGEGGTEVRRRGKEMKFMRGYERK